MPAGGSILLGDVAQHMASVNIACNFCERRQGEYQPIAQ